MPEKEGPVQEALIDAASALSKHGVRLVISKYGREALFGLATMAAFRLTFLASRVGVEVAAEGGVFFVCVLVLALGRRTGGRPAQRSPELQAQIDRLASRARGEGSSAAESQLRAGLERISNEIASQIASIRGMNPVQTQHEILTRNAALMATANREAAELRLKEVAEAERQLADVLAREKQG